MRNTILRSAAIFGIVVLAGLAGSYVGSSEADALGLSALPRVTGAVLATATVSSDEQIVSEDLHKLARQAMNDLIASGRHAQD